VEGEENRLGQWANRQLSMRCLTEGWTCGHHGGKTTDGIFSRKREVVHVLNAISTPWMWSSVVTKGKSKCEKLCLCLDGAGDTV
jgi:hypothetical protein